MGPIVDVLESSAAELNVGIVPCPAVAFDEDGFLKEEYSAPDIRQASSRIILTAARSCSAPRPSWDYWRSGLDCSSSPASSSCGMSIFLRFCWDAQRPSIRRRGKPSVAELVEERFLPNAVALNSTSFNAARMIGPAIAGGLIAGGRLRMGVPDQCLSFVAVLCSLALLRRDELKPSHRAVSARGSFIEGFRYVWRRPDLRVILFMLFLVGTFGLNFSIFISTMSVTVFHAGASQYGLLSSMMAAGSVAGALMAAARAKPGIPVLLAAAATFGAGCAVAAMMPNYPRLRHRALCHRPCRPDLHHIDQQPGADLDRARHARTRDRDPARDRTGRNAGRRPDRGLDCRHVWASLGAGLRRSGWTARCDGSDRVSRQARTFERRCRLLIEGKPACWRRRLVWFRPPCAP